MKRKNIKRLRLTAYHEAAHAVVNYRAAGFVGGYVSIVPRQKENVLRLGVASDAWSDIFNSEHMEAKIVSLYAGGHAQRILEPSEGAGVVIRTMHRLRKNCGCTAGSTASRNYASDLLH
jgi:ATP-dependent Zn protease